MCRVDEQSKHYAATFNVKNDIQWVGRLAVIKIMHDKKIIIQSQKLMNLAKLLRVPLALVNGC
jgi:hypothetical protein